MLSFGIKETAHLFLLAPLTFHVVLTVLIVTNDHKCSHIFAERWALSQICITQEVDDLSHQCLTAEAQDGTGRWGEGGGNSRETWRDATWERELMRYQLCDSSQCLSAAFTAWLPNNIQLFFFFFF